MNIRIRLWRAKFFPIYHYFYYAFLSVTQGLTRTQLSCCSRTDSTVKRNKTPSNHVPNYSETWNRVSILWYRIVNPIECCGNIIFLCTLTFTVLRIGAMKGCELNNNKHFQNVSVRLYQVIQLCGCVTPDRWTVLFGHFYKSFLNEFVFSWICRWIFGTCSHRVDVLWVMCVHRRLRG
jgi:hypothetical protein